MDILEWISRHRPGEVTDSGETVEIRHFSGEHSTLWRGSSRERRLTAVYGEYIGCDLFSSTFKLASLGGPLCADGVELVGTLDELARELDRQHPVFEEPVLPFMVQAGIGIYSLGLSSNTILEWDTELRSLTDQFRSLNDVFDEWLEAIS